jgi:drug/metabolite transporter (DMT)-like permease
VAMAAAILLPLAYRRGALRGLSVKWLLAFAVVEITIPFPLIAFGETSLSSSLTAILIAAVPLIVAVLALRFDHSERPTRTRFVGMLVGLAGVTALVGIDVAGETEELIGALAILGAAVGYACGPMIVKRQFATADPMGPIAGALGIASVLLLPAGLAGMPSEAPSGDAIASMLVLGFVCTAIAFLLFFRLITEIGPGRATVITYINPVVALALGVAILDESVTTGTIVGLLLILAGSWLSTDGRLPPGLMRRLYPLSGVARTPPYMGIVGEGRQE